MMKKPKAVVDAESALAARTAEVAELEEALRMKKLELSDAYVAVNKARMDADADKPQCRAVRVSWRIGKEDEGAPYVIVRRTSGGLLVVRRVGGEGESKFKYSESSGRYREVKARSSSWSTAHLELRDVPAEYTAEGRE